MKWSNHDQNQNLYKFQIRCQIGWVDGIGWIGPIGWEVQIGWFARLAQKVRLASLAGKARLAGRPDGWALEVKLERSKEKFKMIKAKKIGEIGEIDLEPDWLGCQIGWEARLDYTLSFIYHSMIKLSMYLKLVPRLAGRPGWLGGQVGRGPDWIIPHPSLSQ